MSQVLEKPILLDETGRSIAGKLDTNADAIVDMLEEIKDAIGTSSEFIPVKIQVVTPPTKTIYKVGESLDLTGMVVNLVGTNGVQIDVTSACTFSPANGATLTSSDTAVTVTYLYQRDSATFTTSQAITIRELSSIAVTTPPIKTAYQTGETLDLTGIVVTATYSDGYTDNVTADCTFNPSNGTALTSSDTSVTVTYVEGSVTKTTSVAIGVKELLSIAVTHLPVKTAYHAGEVLDLTGLAVTASYDDGSTVNVTNNCTYSPDDGDTLTTSNTSVAISYTEGTTTKTTSQVITVSSLSSIAITTPPTKVDYANNEDLDLTGIVVTATYSDGTTAVVTSSCTFNPANGTTLTTSDTAVTVTHTEGGITKTATQAITVTVPIYGAEWAYTASPAWTRTDAAASFTDPVPAVNNGNGSSPFDNIMPWAGMERVEDANAGTLVKIPKFWYKLTRPSSWGMKIQISSEAADGFLVSPAHADRGDGKGERDYVYVGAYHCTSTYKSTTGQTPMTNKTRAEDRNGIHALGTDIWQWDYATVWTIRMLYLVEFAHWNSQDKIGYGTTYPLENNGFCDSMTYHTGTSAANRSTAGHIRYRYIEDLWGNTPDWCDGIYFAQKSQYNNDLAKIMCIKNPAQFSDSSNGTYVGDRNTSYNKGYIQAFGKITTQGFEYAMMPQIMDKNGDGTGYTCDWGTYGSSGDCLIVGYGAPFNASPKAGLFATWGEMGTQTQTTMGSRLMKLPNS